MTSKNEIRKNGGLTRRVFVLLCAFMFTALFGGCGKSSAGSAPAASGGAAASTDTGLSSVMAAGEDGSANRDAASQPGETSQPGTAAQAGAASQADAAAQAVTSSQAESRVITPHQTITAKTAKQMMDKEEDYVLLDARSIEEYQDKRIPGAMLIPDYQITDMAESMLPDKDALIFVYCRGGVRSERASRALSDLGYSRVYDFGGIASWPYDTVSGVEDSD